MTKYIPRSFDDGNVSGVVEHFEHDGAVELARGVLAELQLYQALGVQRLARARVHLVLLDEWQDVQQVKYVTLQTDINIRSRFSPHLLIAVGISEGLETERAVIEGKSLEVHLVRISRPARLLASEEIFPLLSCEVQLVRLVLLPTHP